MRKAKKHLNFESMRQIMADQFNQIEDTRTQEFTKHSIHDVMLSGFGMMYCQDPSLLQFQQRMEDSQEKNNLSSLLRIDNIPKSSQMRKIIDQVDPEIFRPIFKEKLHRLQRGKQLAPYQLFKNQYLCALDGGDYFASEKLCCKACLEKKHRNGTVGYSHKILQAAIMHPDKRQVLPLMPEEICNEDGYKKQDCENKAAKRLLRKIRQDHPQLDLIIGGDSLYSKQPLIETILQLRMHYLLVAKPDDHKVMMKTLDEQAALGKVKALEEVDKQGMIHRYEWINGIALNGNQDAIEVNFFRYFKLEEKDGQRTVRFKSSWVTDFEIDANNVKTLVAGGRCRWKIENECFNTLKNQGYYIDHNYGHGKKHLSFNFLLLTLLAFFFHQIFELSDELFQACRRKYGSKRYLWEVIRSIIRFFWVESWETVLQRALTPDKFRALA